MKTFIFLVLLFSCFFYGLVAQELVSKPKSSLKGRITDNVTNEPLIGATIQIVGTYNSAPTDLDGNFILKNIHPGDYSIKITYIGYADKIYNGVTIKEGEEKTLNITMTEAQNTLGEVVVEGGKNLVDLESGRSGFKITSEDIKEMNVRDVQQLAALQPGVNQTPDGLQIRGGRVYETSYLVDGISATDPLAGNGRGVGLSANSIQDLNVVTGSAGAEYSDAVSGVIAARVKEGGSKTNGGASWITDNQNKLWGGKMGWNTDLVNVYLSGPVPGLKGKMTYFTSFDMQLSDDYTIYPNGDPNLPSDTRFKAHQLKSSILDNPNEPNDVKFSKILAPRQDNKWTHTFKMTYNIRKGMKISITNQHSLNINQNTRSLLVQGFGAVMVPGFQYDFSRDMDNATTYTHQTNLTALNFKWLFGTGWSYDLSMGRLFTNLRADANGLPFRPETIDRVYDPNSIVTNPVSVFNPNDSIVYVNPGPGVVNNNGISSTWHDHYVEEYTINHKFTKASANGRNFITFGWQHKEQSLQWVDVTSPWVGAPIKINDSLSTKAISVGSQSDLWKADPASGAVYFTDEIRYKGIIATFGLRFAYWTLGKYADDAVNNPISPLTQPVRDQYLNQTVDLGRRYNARVLPNIEVKFPVTDNNVLFFNYAQSMRNEHPLFYYQGLNPVYTNNSYQGSVGNPALKPSVVASYEMGLKSQITKNAAITFTAYYKDYFDYAKKATIEVADYTGQSVLKQTYINQDYSRVRGFEAVYAQRIGKLLRTTLSATYQVATGKSNTAYESSLQIIQQGFTSANKEQYMAWDTPFESKLSLIFNTDSNWRLGNIPLRGIRVFVSSVFKSNQSRYTRQDFTGYTDYGRPIYQDNQTTPYTELSAPLFWTDLKVSKDLVVKKKVVISLTVEFKNIFNNQNSQLINNVTGTAYQYGQSLPISQRDPQFNNPQDNGNPPYNPARFMQPRQMLVGLAMSF